MPVYSVLSDTDIKRWNTEYKTMADQLAGEADPAEQARLTTAMQVLGAEVQSHLLVVGGKIRDYYTLHSGRVDNWMRLSDTAIKAARKAAAAYKKDTRTGVPPQIQQAAADLTLYVKAINDDAREFGESWFGYRTGPANHVPGQYLEAFQTGRSKIMEGQKAVTTKQLKVSGYAAEALALSKVVGKATMKAGIKAGTGQQRDIEVAVADATELADHMSSELALLKNPRGLATQPMTMETALPFVKADSKNKAFTATPANVTSVTGRKKTFESGIKLMRTRVAAMRTVMATRLKGFRSQELTNDDVKPVLKAARKSLKDAETDLAASEVIAKKGLAYIAVIEARWKAKKK